VAKCPEQTGERFTVSEAGRVGGKERAVAILLRALLDFSDAHSDFINLARTEFQYGAVPVEKGVGKFITNDFRGDHAKRWFAVLLHKPLPAFRCADAHGVPCMAIVEFNDPWGRRNKQGLVRVGIIHEGCNGGWYQRLKQFVHSLLFGHPAGRTNYAPHAVTTNECNVSLAVCNVQGGDGLIGRHLADPQSLCALILCEEGKFISRFFQAVHHKIGGGIGYKRVNPARKNLFEQCMNGRTVGAAGSRLLHHPATLFHSP